MNKPKNMKEAQQRLLKARADYLRAREKNKSDEMKKLSQEIFDLHDWMAANG